MMYLAVSDPPDGTEVEVTAPMGVLVSVAVTGQMVVYRGIVTVVRCSPAGQLVTVGAQEVTVITEVV